MNATLSAHRTPDGLQGARVAKRAAGSKPAGTSRADRDDARATSSDSRSSNRGWTNVCVKRQADGLTCGLSYFVWTRETSNGRHRKTRSEHDSLPHVCRDELTTELAVPS